ncbi:MAG: hypothetical protein LW860_18440 [Xanthomonadaceae bacterium]|jgi:hypothetical protein|nr:hypothetical protein [Xanthomonadaceae bacterium]
MERLLRIAAVSVEAADLERIRHAVEAVRGRLTASVRWADAADADVLLIDVDSIYGHMDWVRARGNGRNIVALSDRAAQEGESAIQRPVSDAGVAAALAYWIQRLGLASAADGARASTPPAAEPRRPAVAATPAATPAPVPAAATVPAPVVTDPAPLPAATAAVDPIDAVAPPPAAVASELPLAEYCTIEALPRAARIVLDGAPALTIDNERGVYYGPGGLKALEAYARGSIPREAWEPVSPAVLEGLRAAGGGQPTARLVWLGALLAGNGQWLGGDASTRVRLAKWPQIEREFPRHFRIATVMMKGFATIDEIAQQSGAQPTEVADFANASLAAGHAEVEAPAVPAATPETAGGGLLGRFGLRARKG